MSVYDLAGGSPSYTYEVRTVRKALPPVSEWRDVEWRTLETDAKNTLCHVCHTAAFVTMRLNHVEGLACLASMII